MSIEQSESTQVRFPGHEFVVAREQRHLSIEQVSIELNLPIKVLIAIESGSLQTFQNAVFLRGYIRTYAKYLGLDANHYANLYANLPGVDLKPTNVRSTPSLQPLDPSKSPIMKAFTWLFLFAIIAVIVWWSREQYGLSPVVIPEQSSSEVSSARPSVVNEPGSTLITTVESSFSEAIISDIGSSSDTAEVSDNSNVELSGVLPGEETSLDEVALAEAEGLREGLYIRFIDDCWVQVRDASDRLIYSGVAQGGTELQLEGSEPLSLVIGRRDAVEELFFNGELISLSSFTSGNVARFSLPLNQ